jgi:hypothetical protein
VVRVKPEQEGVISLRSRVEALLRPNEGRRDAEREGGKDQRGRHSAVRRPVRVDGGGGASPVRFPTGKKEKEKNIGTRRACPLAPALQRVRHGEPSLL